MPTNAELAKMLKESQIQTLDVMAKITEQLEANSQDAQALRDDMVAMKEQVSAIEEGGSMRRESGNFASGFRPAPDGGGWVIRSTNKLYNGNTCGVRFIQGMAVIPNASEQDEIKVKRILGDYKGYTAQPVGERDLDSFNRFIATNLAELMEGNAEAPMEEKLARMSTPNFTGATIINE
jgi:hypothetical protein